MNQYNWQQPDWPNFQYTLTGLEETLLAIAEKAGLIKGKLAHLADTQQTEALIDTLVEEAVKTSEIEGEYISRPDVRSSIKNKLGLVKPKIPIQDKRAQGMAELLLDVRDQFKESLTQKNLFAWHSMLFDSSKSNFKVGHWRTHEEPMQIVSSQKGKYIVHYEAPASNDVPQEMKQFIHWFNDTAPGSPQTIKFAPVRSAIAHLYFESIHPFEDGNGRIGRAIAEKALSQGFGYPVMISLSRAIEANKNAYYDALHKASKKNEITEWIRYFIDVILEAQHEVEQEINFILKKSAFFDAFKNELNERQLKVIRRMLESGVKGFEGGMSAKKYMSIAKTSKATATRDLQKLFSLGALKQIGSGRNVRYELNFK